MSAALVAPSTVARAEPSPAELTDRIEKSSTELEKVVESYNKLKEDMKATKAASVKLSAQMGPLEKEAGQAEAQMGDLATTAYKTGGLRTAGALLDRGSGGTLLSRLGTLDKLARERQQQVAGFDETRRRYQAEKTRLDTTMARQNAQAKQLEAGKKKIEGELSKLYEMRRKAYGSATSKGSRYTGSIPSVSGSAGVAVRYAYNAIGKPYGWGEEGPGSYDCSGLTLAAWRAAGRSLPHNAAMQWDATAHISRSQLAPGDLVFYSGLGHVGIYVGGNQVIHAPTFGENVKISSPVDFLSVYGYGRVR
jgi:cell wall-associated NlpC family hydrolase